MTLTRDDAVQAIGLKRDNNMYCMLFKVIKQEDTVVNVFTTSLRKWHERLGHLNKQLLQNVVNKQAFDGIKFSCKNDFFCESCQFGKTHRPEFKINSDKQKWKSSEYIHIVCGPFSETSVGDSRFYLLFVDEASNYRVVHFLRHKSDVFKDYERMVANKFAI